MAIRPTRAETFTANKKQTEFFSDFLNSFAKSPAGNQMVRVTNQQSVNQSIRNIIKTISGERFFSPYVGSDVFASVFQPNDFFQIERLKTSIATAITNFERRAELISVDVRSASNVNLSIGETPITDENSIEVTIIYSLINSIDPITLTFLLKRVR